MSLAQNDRVPWHGIPTDRSIDHRANLQLTFWE